MSDIHFPVGSIVSYTSSTGEVDYYLIVPTLLVLKADSNLNNKWAVDKSWGIHGKEGKPYYYWMSSGVELVL